MPIGPRPHTRRMPNKARPRCPKCSTTMTPLYRKGARGKAMVRAGPTFICPEDTVLAKTTPSRRNTNFLTA